MEIISWFIPIEIGPLKFYQDNQLEELVLLRLDYVLHYWRAMWIPRVVTDVVSLRARGKGSLVQQSGIWGLRTVVTGLGPNSLV